MERAEPTGVLLMAYGTPATLDDVAAYYTHIRGGRPPSAALIEELAERYRLVGGTTPLLHITEATRDALQRRLDLGGRGRYRVYLGMKHWHPYIEETVRAIAEDEVQRAIGLVLAPHYSSMSVAGYYRSFDQAQEKLGTRITLERIASWHLHEPYLAAVARRIRNRLSDFPPGEDVTVVFTAHSLPERILADGDPYPVQLRETSDAIASLLADTVHDRQIHFSFSYQSAGRTPEPWLGPDLVDTVQTLADGGMRNVLVASIGFVSDHLEILYDIDYEARQVAEQRGVRLKRTEMLNASPDFVEGLADLIQARTEDRVRSSAT